MPLIDVPTCPGCAEAYSEYLGPLPSSRWFAGVVLPQPLESGALYRCPACRLKFRHPVQDLSAYQALYNNSNVTSWDSQCARADWDKVIAYIRDTAPQGARILDFGCYTGGLLARLGPKFQRFGIEVNARAAGMAEAQGIRVWPAIENIPAEDRFDFVVACDVIEHMNDPEAFALALVSLTSADGQVIITTGDAENRLWERFGANWWYCFYPEHIVFISQKWLSSLSRKHDLRINQCKRFFRLRSHWLKRLAICLATVWYGLFPRSYLATIRHVSRWRRASEPRSVPGNGACADHLFISLSRGKVPDAVSGQQPQATSLIEN